MYYEIRFAGFGGQGIIKSGEIAGKAAINNDKYFATMVQNYGPESRGGSSSAQVIISDSQIAYPIITQPDILVVMSQEAYSKYAAELKPGGIMLVEEDMVNLGNPPANIRIVKVPATRLAEESGKKMVANIVMLGALKVFIEALTKEALVSAIKSTVPPGTEEVNLKAFQKGIDCASAFNNKVNKT
ncbi:MAG: 2-oxoacid:acceptor oxidoreductase family protein [Planctomycetota bacterium]